MLLIPPQLYEYHLTDWLQKEKNNPELSDNQRLSAEILYRLSKIQMQDDTEGELSQFIEHICPTNEEIEILTLYVNSDNLQIRAQVNDVLRCTVKDKRQHAVIASYAYLKLATMISAPWFLLRSVTVRSIKQLMDTDYLQRLCCVIDVSFFSAWVVKIAKELRKSYEPEQLNVFKNVIDRHLESVEDNSNRNDERNCLDALHEIDCLCPEEWHRRKALSFEKELDYTNNHKKPNTLYPNNVNVIQNAYNEIYRIKKKYADDYERIKAKLQHEQKMFFDALKHYGVRTTIEVPTKFIEELNRLIEEEHIENAIDALAFIAAFPFPTDTEYEKGCQLMAKASQMNCYFGLSTVGNKGQNIGKAEPEESIKIQVHQYYKRSLIYMIAHVLDYGRTKEKIVDVDAFAKEISNGCKTSYITPDRMPLWTKGLIAGLKGDFIIAAHLLMPQIEHSLVLKAESYVGSLTALHNENHQDEPSLAKVLDVLKPYMPESLNDEFRFFLNCGADVNCRNNLAHGLWSTMQCQLQGQYLWWLAVKMFFKENDLFILQPS